MAQTVNIPRAKGPSGVAVLKAEGKKDISITLLPVEKNEKTGSEARPGKTIILPRDAFPAYVLNNLAAVKRWNVRLSAKEDKVYGAAPCDTTLEMRYTRFWSAPLDKEKPNGPFADPVPTASMNRWGNPSYKFTAVFSIVEDDDWEGFDASLILDHINLTSAPDGSIAFVGGRDGAKLIRQFMMASGVDVDEWTAPYSSNCLPEIDKALKAAGPGVVFLTFNENGYVGNISPSARKAKAAKKTTKK